jgi:ATP-dependent Clp protease ATP-binding subunit ClpC
VLLVFSRETGIPGAILDEQASLDLTATRAWFDQRLLGQPEALSQVVDLLAMIKSRLARPGKPLASLLFAGPTGVGKTETAKVLAEFLFGDKERLVRFDMSEYADPFASRRLIGGAAEGEGLLTRAIREQPFSVLLLDEFEKAHGDVFDILLQVLGEGRLTDQKGRTADFRNAVVFMTSDLGARGAFRAHLGLVDSRDERANAREHFREAVRDFFRPEMFNRIDALIAFAPLDGPTLRRIVERELELLRNRDGFRLRGVELILSGDIAGYLVRKGYDPRYGARPLKRITENELVTPLASRLNAYPDDVSLSCTVSEVEDRLHLEVAVLTESKAKGRMRDQPGMAQPLFRVLARCATLRRQMHSLRTSRTMLELDNEIHRLEMLQRRYKARAASRGEAWAGAWMLGDVTDTEILKRLPGLHALAGCLLPALNTALVSIYRSPHAFTRADIQRGDDCAHSGGGD